MMTDSKCSFLNLTQSKRKIHFLLIINYKFWFLLENDNENLISSLIFHETLVRVKIDWERGGNFTFGLKILILCMLSKIWFVLY